MKKIPMINLDDKNFNEKLEACFNYIQGSSAYSNDRSRPYNGQPWTDNGERGKTEVKGLTMRDIKDCFIKALLISSPDDEYLEISEFLKCWDFSNCKNENDKPSPTQYLLDKQKEGKYISTKVETGNWRHDDVYLLKTEHIDPIAVAQHLCCEIEKMMGIFPNIKIEENIDNLFSEDVE